MGKTYRRRPDGLWEEAKTVHEGQARRYRARSARRWMGYAGMALGVVMADIRTVFGFGWMAVAAVASGLALAELNDWYTKKED